MTYIFRPLPLLLFSLMLLNCLNLKAQEQGDTLRFEPYLDLVKKNHPLAKQAGLQSAFAAARRKKAKGAFDPTIRSNWDEKYFDSKHYFQIFETQIEVPLQYGLKVNGAYERNEGVFLNPENKTDAYGLWALGIEANLGQGLLFDQRRAGLKLADIQQAQFENTRVQIINTLLFNAALSFIDWQEKSAIQKILKEGLTLANVYFEATKAAFENGEKPAIDTLEAMLVVQDRNNDIQQNAISLSKNEQLVRQYLWENGKNVVTLNQEAAQLQTASFNQSVPPNTNDMIASFPKIKEKQLKQTSYQVEEKLKKEKLKPKVKLKYQPLLATSDSNIVPSYSINDYKWGISFGMPLLRRVAKADLEENRLKQEALNYEIKTIQAELRAKIDFNKEQQRQLVNLLVLQRSNTSNYRLLLEGEQERFKFGESSVFLLNKRQEKYLAAQIKYIKLLAVLKKSEMELIYLSNGFDN